MSRRPKITDYVQYRKDCIKLIKKHPDNIREALRLLAEKYGFSLSHAVKLYYCTGDKYYKSMSRKYKLWRGDLGVCYATVGSNMYIHNGKHKPFNPNYLKDIIFNKLRSLRRYLVTMFKTSK